VGKKGKEKKKIKKQTWEWGGDYEIMTNRGRKKGFVDHKQLSGAKRGERVPHSKERKSVRGGTAELQKQPKQNKEKNREGKELCSPTMEQILWEKGGSRNLGTNGKLGVSLGKETVSKQKEQQKEGESTSRTRSTEGKRQTLGGRGKVK